MHRLVSATFLAASLAVTHLAAAQTPADAVTKALANPARADQRDDDARRKAEQVLVFSGVKPGDTVIDFVPGSGYWTRIFSGIVGPSGHVYALWPRSFAKYAAKPLPVLQARKLDNVTAQVQDSDAPSVPQPADLFWTVQNYHDMANGGGDAQAALQAFNAAVFKALKPGGTYVVIDHADAAGAGLGGTEARHRIDEAVVIEQVKAAGFTLAGESDVLRNPDDPHTATVFDPSIRGRTDQFVLKFTKPK